MEEEEVEVERKKREFKKMVIATARVEFAFSLSFTNLSLTLFRPSLRVSCFRSSCLLALLGRIFGVGERKRREVRGVNWFRCNFCFLFSRGPFTGLGPSSGSANDKERHTCCRRLTRLWRRR